MIGYLLAKLFAKAYTAPIWVIPYSVRKARHIRRRRR